MSTETPILDKLETPGSAADVVMLSGRGFVLACAVVSGIILFSGRWIEFPIWLLAAEVLATILALFLLGSFKYQIHKNALTYGMLLVIIATFVRLGASEWHRTIRQEGWWHWAQVNLLSFHGLDDMIHADTMLFILGLTFFVSVIAQTRLLEGITFILLRRNQGAILPTVLSVTAFVAVASGIFDGVSMIGLTIRTLVILLLLAAAPTSTIRYSVIVCTLVTTICGTWLAYGEPPNLIMKANLYPELGNLFFLIYCAPAAFVSYLLIARQLRKRLQNQHVFLDLLDVVEANAQDVRFLQATRHGEVLTPIEFIESRAAELGKHAAGILKWLHQGESLGLALFREKVPEETRRNLLGHFVSEDLAEPLDRHYQLAFARDMDGAREAEQAISETLASLSHVRRRAQKIGAIAMVPFIGLLILHGFYNDMPLFWASFAGFLFALAGIARIPKMRTLAFHEAHVEYAEYYFLFPLFLSITLLTKSGFFDQIQT
ncbi:MAG: SLC13 family permease, partial [Candidatus Acidiferrales bacterium]